MTFNQIENSTPICCLCLRLTMLECGTTWRSTTSYLSSPTGNWYRIVAICYQTLNMFYFTLAHERFVMIWCTRRISPFRHFMRACGLTLHLIAHVGALILGVCTDQPQQRRRVLARSWDHSPTPKNSEMDRNNEQNFEILWPKMTKMVCVSKSLSRPQIGLRTMNNQPRVRGRAVKTSEATNHHQASKSDPMPTSSLSVCSIDPVSSWPSRISC